MMIGWPSRRTAPYRLTIARWFALSAVLSCLTLFALHTAHAAYGQTKLTASATNDGATFGRAVAMDGDVVVVGADGDNTNGNFAGAVYVYEPDGGGSYSETKLLASDGRANDQFGVTVAVENDIVVVGAPNSDDQTLLDTGAVYIYEANGGGGYTETKLTASDESNFAYFGSSVAIDDGVIVVGASNETIMGAVYVYEPDGGGGYTETKLLASDRPDWDFFSDGDAFGASVAIDNGVIAVGAFRNDATDFNSGAAYVYTPDGGGGYTEAKLTPTAGAANGQFGYSVAVQGGTVIVGANAESNGVTTTGAAYVFTPDGGDGYDTTKLTPADGAADDRFGTAVAMANDVIYVGSMWDDDRGGFSGSVYVHTPDGLDGYTVTKLTASDGDPVDQFGGSVAADGTALVVGAFTSDDGGSNSGSAYVFVPQADVAPVLDAIGDQSATVGRTLTFTVTATDGNSDPLVYSLTDGTSGSVPLGASIDTITGVFRWTPDTIGSATFDVVVSDGELTDAETITVTVAEATETDLIFDGGFETDADPWGVPNTSGDRIKCNKIDRPNGKPDKIFAYNGDCAFRFKGSDGENSRIIQKPDVSGLSLSSGDTLTVSLWADVATDTNTFVKLVAKHEGGTKDKLRINLLPTTGYTEVTDTLTLTGDATSVKLLIRNRSQSGKVYIDDVSLTHATGTPPFAPVDPGLPILPDAPDGFRK